jgi:uncharacterized repeat protein (TIGR03803 family)
MKGPVGDHTMNVALGILRGAAVLVAIAAPTVAPAAESPYALAHSFDGHDGAFPDAGLLASANGVLYGTTTGGGPASYPRSGGVAFSLTPTPAGGHLAWTSGIIHRFGESATDGSTPHSRFVADRQGRLYGTTFGGGTWGQGTVYRLTPSAPGEADWREQILYSFHGGTDGANPTSEVVFDDRGRLYGTTSIGGAGHQGTVYRLQPPQGQPAPQSGSGSRQGDWTFQLLHGFSGPDGAAPRGGLLARRPNGTLTLFGTTTGGGEFGQGTVFSLAEPVGLSGPWPHVILHDFTGGPDGAVPSATLSADRALALYGTTMQGGNASAGSGGVVFRLTPPTAGKIAWTELVLHSFGGGGDGQFPLGAVTERLDGRLFGTSAGAGYSDCTTQCGTVFELTPAQYGGDVGPWHERVLHRFSGRDGDLPSAELTPVQGPNGVLAFYGVTETGGADDMGGVFKITP